MEWLKQLGHRPDDTIVVAGDIATSMAILQESLQLLTQRFQHVFFVPGNHELWLTGSRARSGENSLSKFFDILNLCDQLGVHTTAAYVGDVLLVPLFSWYKGGDSGGLGHGTSDPVKGFDSYCKWPVFVGRGAVGFKSHGSLQPQIAEFFADINQLALNKLGRTTGQGPKPFTISFSHFLPHKELYPGMTQLRHIMGCEKIAHQISECAPDVHVFGHSHLNVDEMIDNTRFVQAALGHQSDHSVQSELESHTPTLLWAHNAKGYLRAMGLPYSPMPAAAEGNQDLEE